jgi:hypothetical protein|eukprot:COSAG01_NODE_516_length_16026_cov_63.502857_12_plen_329_part_00
MPFAAQLRFAALLLPAAKAVASPAYTTGLYGTFELAVTLHTQPDNVFDVPSSVAAIFADPTSSAAPLQIQPFWHQNFSRHQLSNGSEVLTPVGRPHFLLRFTPSSLGVWKFTLHGAIDTAHGMASGSLHVVGEGRRSSHGFASVAPGQQYFRAGNSTPLFLLGENIVFPGPDPILTTYNYTNDCECLACSCTPPSHSWCRRSSVDARMPVTPAGADPPAHMGTYMYDQYFAKLAAAGGNYVRLWVGLSCLPPKNTPISLAGGAGAKFGAYSLEAAWRIDHILALGEQHGIYVLICFESQQSVSRLSILPAVDTPGRWGWDGLTDTRGR